MTVPALPKLTDIQTEYGGSGTLRSYVRGGAFSNVSNTNISTNASALTIRQFAGTSADFVMITGSVLYNTSAGKGTAASSLAMSGYNSVAGTYTDRDSYYSQAYSTFGTGSGVLAGTSVTRCWFASFSSDDSSTGYNERTLNIVVNGTVTGSKTPYVNGSAIAGAKTGVSSGGVTTFIWFYGTKANSGGTVQTGSDSSTPALGSKPFGNDNVNNIVKLI